MHTPSFRVLITLTLVTLIGTAAIFSAPKPKKVKGTIDGTIMFSPSVVAPGVYAIKVECSGALSKLGRTKAVWEGDALLDANLAATPLAAMGWRLTAADGSTMQGTLEWQAQNNSIPGSYTVMGTLHLVSGTGRYQGATGSCALHGTTNVLTGKVSFRLDGEVLQMK
jgi:hypothetical protein